MTLVVISGAQEIKSELLQTPQETTRRSATDSSDIEKNRLKTKRPKDVNSKWFYQSIVISSHQPSYLKPLTPIGIDDSNYAYIYYANNEDSASAPIDLRGHKENNI